MLSLFATLKDNVPMGQKLRDPLTEGFSNRLHYRVTVLLLLGCSILVTCLEWVGNGKKISCILVGAEDSWVVPKDVINTYCFIKTTFTLPREHWGQIGSESAYPGVGSYKKGEEDLVTHHAYYQWVPFVLFLQACMFYIPHALLKMWEGGKVKNIIVGLNQLILDRRERADKERVLAEYFVASAHTHNIWALKILSVDFLNLINVIGNIYFIDTFLGGEFSTFGFDVLNFLEADPETRIDPMYMVFPRMTKCSFQKYGPSGSIQNIDSLCVLPINIISEKIYVFLWFWLILLTVFTILGLIYHVSLMLTPALTKAYLNSRCMNQKSINLDEIGQHLEVGDWKLLHVLAKNMEPLVLGEFLKELFMKIREELDKKRNKITLV